MRILRLAAAATAVSGVASFALAQNCAGRAENPSTYRETAVFNQVVGDERFVGAFEAGPNRCDITIFQAAAKDQLLAGPLRRMVLPIAAGSRSLLGVGPDSALAISCAANAKAIEIAPQSAPKIGEN